VRRGNPYHVSLHSTVNDEIEIRRRLSLQKKESGDDVGLKQRTDTRRSALKSLEVFFTNERNTNLVNSNDERELSLRRFSPATVDVRRVPNEQSSKGSDLRRDGGRVGDRDCHPKAN
jgi:hypothetical protein